MKRPSEQRFSQNNMLLGLLVGVALLAVIGFLLFVQPAQTDPNTLNRYEYEGDSVSASDPVEDIPAMDAGVEEADEETDEDSEAALAEEAAEDDDEEDDEEDDADDEDAVAEITQPQEFAAPMESAEVMRAYSVDALTFDETMRDWRTHAATDYAGESGDAVTAFTDGTVVEIGEDALRGTYVVLNHANGLRSSYAGLGNVMVQEGDSVTCGQQIAELGEPMPSEAAQGVHLHLEVTQDGKPVDAQTFQKNNSSTGETS